MEDCSNCAAGGAVAHTAPRGWREDAGVENVNLNQPKHKKWSLSSLITADQSKQKGGGW